MKVAIYSRVSTDMQDTNNQKIALEKWAQNRGFEVILSVCESESAWKAGHQRILASLINDARKHKFEAIVVWALDRLSREGSLAILQLTHRLKSYGVHVISYQESWTEVSGELDELLFALTGWVARMESQRRSERTKAGITRRRKETGSWGRPQGSKDKKKRKRSIKNDRRQKV